jgi:hypothetical protein
MCVLCSKCVQCVNTYVSYNMCTIVMPDINALTTAMILQDVMCCLSALTVISNTSSSHNISKASKRLHTLEGLCITWNGAEYFIRSKREEEHYSAAVVLLHYTTSRHYTADP